MLTLKWKLVPSNIGEMAWNFSEFIIWEQYDAQCHCLHFSSHFSSQILSPGIDAYFLPVQEMWPLKTSVIGGFY